jgi:hypothetical protein
MMLGQSGMRYTLLIGFLGWGGAYLAGCSSDDNSPRGLPTFPAAGGRKGTGGKGSAGLESDAGDAGPGDGGGSGGTDGGGAGNTDAGKDPFAPIVKIISPDAVSDPNTGTVIINDGVKIVGNQIPVTCTVDRGNGDAGFGAATVQLEMFDATHKSVGMFPGMGTTPPTDVYSASFSFTNVDNGPISFQCSVMYGAGKVAKATLSTFVDHGPKITLAPFATKAIPPHNLPLDFTVAADPLSPGDMKADVDPKSIAIEVLGHPIEVTTDDLVMGVAGHYALTVHLDDTKTFQTPPSGSVPIVIRATNGRGATQVNQSNIVVDGDGPQITILSPKDDDIIPGQQQLSFTVTDAGSGVDPATVSVTTRGVTSAFDSMNPLWTQQGTMYTFLLDNSSIKALDQIIVNIAASDLAQNTTHQDSLTLYIDTSPPVVDLDPPLIQEASNASPSLCSNPFDVVGDHSVNDSTPTKTTFIGSTGYFTTRVLAWDEANGLPNAPLRRYRGVAQDSVVLYVQADTGAGLLKDTTKDGICDEIDTSVTLPVVKMKPMQPAGNASHEKTAVEIDGVCTSGTDTTLADALCGKTSDLTRVIEHERRGGIVEPVIYGTVDSLAAECDENQVSPYALSIPNGWVCLAARAEDGTGNVGISPPLRFCLNDPRNGKAPPCAVSSTALPSCVVDGCTPPKHFREDFPQPYVVQRN